VPLEHHRPALALKPAGAIFEVKQSTATSQPVAAQYEINPFKHFINHMRIEYLRVAVRETYRECGDPAALHHGPTSYLDRHVWCLMHDEPKTLHHAAAHKAVGCS
jgi:hypothetical protein